MGRPYKNELRLLPEAYQWAVTNHRDWLKQLWFDQTEKTLIACGSGGSYSAASIAVALHRHYHRSPGYAVTPLELEATIPWGSNCSLWLFSGKGRNVDIRRALKRASILEVNEMTVFCAKLNSPLERDARRLWLDRVFSFEANVGKDGYLATNSLFVSTVFLVASFEKLPQNLTTLIQSCFSSKSSAEELKRNLLLAADGRSNAIVLHGPSGKAGALDLESKFTESALIASSVTDFRNFAHGRHNWINRFGTESFVVAFVGPGEEELARQTLNLIPKHIPQVVLPLGENFATAQILSIYHSIQIVGWMGVLRGIDPGRPRIPEFGRKLYHLRARLTNGSVSRSNRHTIIHRKIAALGRNEDHDASPSFWYKKYSTFRSGLVSVDIRAIVFDYDGTLVETNARFDPPVESVARRIVELLEAGIPIGIATGRGNSVKHPLQTMIPSKFQARTLLGYLNASQITRLNTKVEIDGDLEDPNLVRFWERLQRVLQHTQGVVTKKYPSQISIRPASVASVTWLWSVVQELVSYESDGELKVMTSSHSLDILPKNVSKVSVVQAICKEFSVDESSVLRIGDNGRWPGNDCELLRSSLGLSVRHVSADPDFCWNLLPPRCSGLNGTLYYMDRMQAKDGIVRIQL